MTRETALIIGAGAGLSAALCRLFVKQGMMVALASRQPSKLDGIADETGAATYGCDAAEATDVSRLFEAVAQDIAVPDIVVYNPSYRVRGPITELDPDDVLKAIRISCFGGFLVAQAAARQMLARGSGTMLSPWPPRTNACVFSTETPSSMAMNERMRALSRMPAMPMTRWRGNPEARRAASHMTSSGLVTTMRRQPASCRLRKDSNTPSTKVNSSRRVTYRRSGRRTLMTPSRSRKTALFPAVMKPSPRAGRSPRRSHPREGLP